MNKYCSILSELKKKIKIKKKKKYPKTPEKKGGKPQLPKTHEKRAGNPNFRLRLRAPFHPFGVTSFAVKTPEKKGGKPLRSRD